MQTTLPYFPLEVVVFPGERLLLHVYEDRYKQLIYDCQATGQPFGIPVYYKKKLRLGTEVVLEEVIKEYDNGELDIICNAHRVFELKSFENPLPGKMYSGGVVEFRENNNDVKDEEKENVVALINKLYKNLGVIIDSIDINSFNSFLYAHKIGLSLSQEYRLLQIKTERQRLHFLRTHLRMVIPVVRQLNLTKERIQMNGHFKNFNELDFKDYKL
ncbi:LON peptidase substrate-binding domain-containing protein [Zhouia spongiae]|uniref:LON peptidase substrate-binding domain-containing protein n=1 Tax=Zhouia spongiae TaxID=2202721 RepID=A0ABY3YMJ5_9FLAO|nr:LON peptidase substrate-binding domain-containing protein [Zhouia spongiae]UNY98822.1 LON peptidase substrate-binding domain-containing protein [Zhouia spongiae]